MCVSVCIREKRTSIPKSYEIAKTGISTGSPRVPLFGVREGKAKKREEEEEREVKNKLFSLFHSLSLFLSNKTQ